MDCVVGCCGMQVVDVDAGIHAMSRINVSVRMMEVGCCAGRVGGGGAIVFVCMYSEIVAIGREKTEIYLKSSIKCYFPNKNRGYLFALYCVTNLKLINTK